MEHHLKKEQIENYVSSLPKEAQNKIKNRNISLMAGRSGRD